MRVVVTRGKPLGDFNFEEAFARQAERLRRAGYRRCRDCGGTFRSERRWQVRCFECSPEVHDDSRAVPTERACLGCGQKFKSRGAANRLCEGCRPRDAGLYDNVDDGGFSAADEIKV